MHIYVEITMHNAILAYASMNLQADNWINLREVLHLSWGVALNVDFYNVNIYVHVLLNHFPSHFHIAAGSPVSYV